MLLKQETMSGSGISWAICKSAPRFRQITMPAPTTQFFTGRMPFLMPNQQQQSTEGMLIVHVNCQRIKKIPNSHVELVESSVAFGNCAPPAGGCTGRRRKRVGEVV